MNCSLKSKAVNAPFELDIYWWWIANFHERSDGLHGKSQHRSSESSSLSLGLEEAEDVVDSNWALNISNELSLVLVQEHNLNLGDSTSGT